MLVTRARLTAMCRARDQLGLVEPIDEASPTTVSELAASVGMSTGPFIRAFTRLFGETPHQHRIRARLNRAKQLLAAGHEVTTVCFDVGWSSLGSFSTTFHQKIGMSPSAYRHQARRWVQVPGEVGLGTPQGCFQLMALAFARS